MVPIFLWPLLVEKDNSGADVNASSSMLSELSPFLLSGPKVIGWFLLNVLLSGIVRRGEFGTSRLKTLLFAKKEPNSVTLVAAFMSTHLRFRV